MAKYLFYIDTIERTGGAQRVMAVLCEHFGKNNEIVLVNDYIHDSKNVTDSLLTNENIKIIYLSDTVKGNFVTKNIRRMKKLKKIILQEKPDLCLSFLGGCNLRMLLCMGKKKGIRRIVSVRNDPDREYSHKRFFKNIVKSIFHRADGVVFQTEDASSYFDEKTKNKSVTIYNPVDEVFFKTKNMEPKYDIVTLGRINQQKNHKLLIEAFDIFRKSHQNKKLHIFGIGPLKEELQKTVDDLDLTGSAIFEGSATNPELVLAQSEVFVLSSDYEGMPNALMEALASGVACVSTDCPCGGPKMLIEHGVNGLLVPCNDKDALAGAMETMADDSVRAEFKKKAKESAESFRTEKILDKWKSYFESIMEDNKR